MSARTPEDCDHLLAEYLGRGSVDDILTPDEASRGFRHPGPPARQLCGAAQGDGGVRRGAKIEQSGRAIEVIPRQGECTWRFAFDDPFARGPVT